MSAFEDFVQQELPKRGYLNSDPDQETIIVRRGMGPRQFDAVTLAEGEVLAMVGGVLQGTNVSAVGGGVRKSITTVVSPVPTWTLTHNLGSENVIVQVFDTSKSVVIPQSIQIIDEDTVEITFGSAQAGVARIIFLD